MKFVCGLMAVLMLAACSSLPVLRPVAGISPESGTSCPAVFVQDNTRFIHAIEAQAGGKTQAVMIGVTLLNPGAGSISSAIISTEGLSLFEAESVAGKIKVGRALPPFDAPDFSQNMMEDIALIFLPPSGVLYSKGVLADGRTVCRWHQKIGGWVDIGKDAQGRTRIERYTENGGLKRLVTIATDRNHAFATIDLQASDLISYRLTMTLIESEIVTEDLKN